MSSRRSRSGGRWIWIVFRRKSRSWRNRPEATSAARSELVAEMSRTLARIVRDEPTRSNSPRSRARRIFACWAAGMLPISSMKRVPPSASSKRPARSPLASVKAPRTWPKSSLSNTPSGSPPMLTEMNGRPARSETAWIAWATRPLPVPFSPVMRTLASDGPTRAMSSSTGRIAADWAISAGPCFPRRSWFSCSSRR